MFHCRNELSLSLSSSHSHRNRHYFYPAVFLGLSLLFWLDQYLVVTLFWLCKYFPWLSQVKLWLLFLSLKIPLSPPVVDSGLVFCLFSFLCSLYYQISTSVLSLISRHSEAQVFIKFPFLRVSSSWNNLSEPSGLVLYVCFSFYAPYNGSIQGIFLSITLENLCRSLCLYLLFSCILCILLS